MLTMCLILKVVGMRQDTNPIRIATKHVVHSFDIHSINFHTFSGRCSKFLYSFLQNCISYCFLKFQPVYFFFLRCTAYYSSKNESSEILFLFSFLFFVDCPVQPDILVRVVDHFHHQRHNFVLRLFYCTFGTIIHNCLQFTLFVQNVDSLSQKFLLCFTDFSKSV